MAKKGSSPKLEVTPMMISEVMKAMGRKGGKATVPKGLSMLSKKERSERARQGAAARWAKVREEKKKAQ